MSTAADRALMMSGTMDTSGHGACELPQVAVVFSEEYQPEPHEPFETPETPETSEDAEDTGEAAPAPEDDGDSDGDQDTAPADQPLFDDQGDPVPQALPDTPAEQPAQPDTPAEPVQDTPGAAKNRKASATTGKGGARQGSGPAAAG